MIDVTVVGIGEAFRERYIEGNRILGKEGENFRFTDLIDIKSEEVVKEELEGKVDDFRFHQLKDTSKEGFRKILAEEELTRNPIIIANPTIYHVPYSAAALDLGMFVVLEKPYGASRTDVQELDAAVERNGLSNLFMLGYYLLEKALPLHLLSGTLDERLEKDVTFQDREPFERWYELIGPLERINAVLLEGKGSVGRIDERIWTALPGQGGNTMETFYHLPTLVELFRPWIGELKVTDATVMRHRETNERHRAAEGELIDTYTEAVLNSDKGVEIRLASGKYVAEDAHQRWFEMKGRNGRVYMDLETNELTIETKEGNFVAKANLQGKYYLQLKQAMTKFRDRNSRVFYDELKSALELSLDVQEVAYTKGLKDYSSEEIDQEYVKVLLN